MNKDEQRLIADFIAEHWHAFIKHAATLGYSESEVDDLYVKLKDE